MIVNAKSMILSVTAHSMGRWWDSIFSRQNQTELVHGPCQDSDKPELSPREQSQDGEVGG